MKKYFFVVFAILLLYSYNICGQERLTRNAPNPSTTSENK